MTVANVTNVPSHFNLTFDISKVDEEKRQVWGYATVEIPDKQRDIVDYQGSIEAFTTWPGNIREQHDPKKAIGKAIEIQPDPDKKAIWLGAYISKSREGEDTWTKVKEGILKGFSIKGEVLEARPEHITKDGGRTQTCNRITKYRLDEVSLVDNPACQEAVILMVKSADGNSLEPTPVLETGSKELTKQIGEFLRGLTSKIEKNYGDAAMAAPVMDEPVGEKDLHRFAQLVMELNDWLAHEKHEAGENGGTPDDIRQLEMLRQAFHLLTEVAQSEIEQYYSFTPPQQADPSMAGDMGMGDGMPGEAPPQPGMPEAPGTPGAPGALGGEPSPMDSPPVDESGPPADGDLEPMGIGEDDLKDEEEEDEPAEESPFGGDEEKKPDEEDSAPDEEDDDDDDEEKKRKKKDAEKSAVGSDENSLEKAIGEIEVTAEELRNIVTEVVTSIIGSTVEKQIGGLARGDVLEKALGEFSKVADAVGRLEERVTKIENQPMPEPDAPAVRAVEKSLGVGSIGGNALVGLGDNDREVLQKMVEKATDPYVKNQLGYALAFMEMKR